METLPIAAGEPTLKLKDLEKESPKEEVEKLIIQAEGVKFPISCVHGISAIVKEKNKQLYSTSFKHTKRSLLKLPYMFPNELPKSEQEFEEEERARMPDSPYTRMLRAIGKFPNWYSPAPNHEKAGYT